MLFSQSKPQFSTNIRNPLEATREGLTCFGGVLISIICKARDLRMPTPPVTVIECTIVWQQAHYQSRASTTISRRALHQRCSYHDTLLFNIKATLRYADISSMHMILSHNLPLERNDLRPQVWWRSSQTNVLLARFYRSSSVIRKDVDWFRTPLTCRTSLPVLFAAVNWRTWWIVVQRHALALTAWPSDVDLRDLWDCHDDTRC